MPRIAALRIALVVALVASACTSSSEEASTTVASTTTLTTSTAPTIATLPVFPDDAELIGTDPDVMIGVLDNGLTYYVRRNTRPGTRAQLRLAVAAGSALEDADQRGVAHYLEHMMFNGTESFPANDLIRVLERFGAEFGPDINAYTSLDQTVYELEVPTDAEGTLETALDVLFEWSSRATLDQFEVDAERGVLLEEWRLRSQSFSGRYFDEVGEVLLAGSPYAGHDPLADEAELNVTSAETLRRFYEDWYRPELMSVVAVGDFQVAEVVRLVRERFEGLASPANPRPRPALTTEPFGEAAFVVLPDPESPNSVVELNYPLTALEAGTVGTARQELALGLAFDMVITRLDEDARRTDAPFFNPSFAANPFVDGQRTPGLAALAEPTDLTPTAQALLEEVRRTIVYGFAEDELARAVADATAVVDLDFEGRSSKQDFQYADEYVAHFLTGSPIPAARERRDLSIRLLEEMTTGQVADTFQVTIESTEPLVIVYGPASAALDIPDETTLQQVVSAAATAELSPRPDSGVTADRLMIAPDPVDIVSRTQLLPLIPTIIELENGVRVAYVESDIAADTVSMQATSSGGWLLLPSGDAVEAQLLGSVVSESGVGEFDQVALSRFLSGQVVEVVPLIDEASEFMFASAEADDLELLFQLVYLYFTEPQADERALESLLNEIRPLAVDRAVIPFLALADQQQLSRYRNDERYLPVPPLADIDSFDLDRAFEVYRERYADASDFLFAFAGDFDPEEVEELARRYLGNLPASGTEENAGTGQPTAPDGAIVEIVDSGGGELGAVSFLFSQEMALPNEVRLTVPVLDSVLNQRLTALLREELGATYSPFVSVFIQDEPISLVEVAVEVSGDPAGLGRIADALESDVADLSTNGPTDDEFAIAVEQTVRNYELIGLQFWLDVMTVYGLDPTRDPAEVADRIPDTMSLTSEDVRVLSERLLRLDDYIRVDLIPTG